MPAGPTERLGASAEVLGGTLGYSGVPPERLGRFRTQRRGSARRVVTNLHRSLDECVASRPGSNMHGRQPPHRASLRRSGGACAGVNAAADFVWPGMFVFRSALGILEPVWLRSARALPLTA